MTERHLAAAELIDAISMPMPRPIAASPVAASASRRVPTRPAAGPRPRSAECPTTISAGGQDHADPPGHGDGDERRLPDSWYLEVGDGPDAGGQRPQDAADLASRPGGRRWRAGGGAVVVIGTPPRRAGAVRPRSDRRTPGAGDGSGDREVRPCRVAVPSGAAGTGRPRAATGTSPRGTRHDRLDPVPDAQRRPAPAQTWLLTVASLTKSRRAISRLDSPSVSRSSTSRSRGERLARGYVGADRLTDARACPVSGQLDAARGTGRGDSGTTVIGSSGGQREPGATRLGRPDSRPEGCGIPVEPGRSPVRRHRTQVGVEQQARHPWFGGFRRRAHPADEGLPDERSAGGHHLVPLPAARPTSRRPSATQAPKKTNRPRSCHGSAAAPSATSAPAPATSTATHQPPSPPARAARGPAARPDHDQQQADGEEQEGRSPLARRSPTAVTSPVAPKADQQPRAGQGDPPPDTLRRGPAAGSHRALPQRGPDQRDGSGGPDDRVQRESREVETVPSGRWTGQTSSAATETNSRCRRRWPRPPSGGRQQLGSFMTLSSVRRT